MVTVPFELESLRQSQNQIGHQQTKTCKKKQQASKEFKANTQAMVNLEKYQQLKLNDWVTNQQEVGQIIELNFSLGGIPQVLISWDNSVPIAENSLDKLMVLEGDWNQGFSKGDQVLVKGQQVATIVKFEWSHEHNCVLPLIKDHETGQQQQVLFDDLSLQDQSTILNQEPALNWANSGIKIIIDPEFKSLIPVLSPEEKSQLENNLIREGCRDPLVIWKGYNILLDGHNRYEICVKNGINYELIEIELPSREDAHLWMMRNQLGRRNLQPEALSYFRGKLQAALKQKVGRKKKETEEKNERQNDAQKNLTENERQNDAKPKTSEILGIDFKVSSRTIERDAKYAKAVDQITELVGSEIRPKILSKTTGKKLTKKKTLELAKTAKRKPEEVIEYFHPGTIKKSNPPEIKPFPFQVGEVVRIIPKRHPNLRGKGGYWAIITQIYLSYCDLQLWNGKVELISAEHLVSLKLTPSECEQMKALCDRLCCLREVAKDALVHHNLQFLGRLKHPKLTPVQETILETIEKIYEDL